MVINFFCFRHDPFDLSDILDDDDDDDDVISDKTDTTSKLQRRKNDNASSAAIVTSSSLSTSLSTGLKKYFSLLKLNNIFEVSNHYGHLFIYLLYISALLYVQNKLCEKLPSFNGVVKKTVIKKSINYSAQFVCCCRCFPVYVGGSDCAKGLSTAAINR